MTLDPDYIGFYGSIDTDGGAIDPSKPQSSGVVGEEFSRISIAERQTGTIRYAKQFVKNDNDEDWEDVKPYIQYQTSLAPNTGAAFALTGSKSRLSTASALSGTATLTATGWIETSVDLREEVATGEMLFNATDSVAKAVRISDMSDRWIQLEGAYTGTTGSAVQLMVAPAITSQFISPTSVDSPSAPITIILARKTRGIWKQYTVWDNCPPFSNDWFTVIFEGT